MFIIFLILIVLVNYTISSSNVIICGLNKTIFFDKNDASPFFIESPGFPHPMNASEGEHCWINVLLSEIDPLFNLIFVITNGNPSVDCDEMRHPFYYFYPTTTNFSIHFINTKVWNAFQGFIFYERRSVCLFSKNPFEFKDDSQIIYLAPNYDEYHRSCSCSWTFIGPKGYGFKILYVSSIKPKTVDLLATNSFGYDIIKGYGLIQNKLYYNTDNFLTIDVTAEEYFEAKITVFKNCWEEDIKDDGCKIFRNETHTIWSSGVYSNNFQCNITIPIPINALFYVSIIYFEAERYVDYIHFSSNNYSSYHNKENDITEVRTFYTQNYEEIIATFVSDGSVMGGGFGVSFQTIKCTCSPEIIVVPCENNNHKFHTILESGLNYVCPNMVCKFKIMVDPTCSLKKAVLSRIEYKPSEAKGLVFMIDTATYNLYNFDLFDLGRIAEIPLLSENVTEIIFDSTKTLMPFSLSFCLSTIDAPTNFDTIILTENNPIFNFDLFLLPGNSFLTVKLDNEAVSNNEKLEIFSTNPPEFTCFLIYDENIKKFTHDFFRFLNGKEYPLSNLKYITIYKPTKCIIYDVFLIPIIFRAKYASTKHCIFTNTIFTTSNFGKPFTAASKSSGFCEIYLIAKSTISELYTNSKTEMVTMQSETNGTSTKLFKINKKDSTLWKNLQFSGLIYSFKIPPRANLILFFKPLEQSIKIESYPYKSFIDTPCCTKNFTDTQNGTLFGTFEISNVSVIFHVEVFDMSPDAVLFATNSLTNTKKNLKNVTHEIIYENTVVKLWYYEPNYGHRGARIFMETAPKNQF